MPLIDDALLASLASVKREPVVPSASLGEQEAFARIVRLAAVRERCQSELRQRLADEGFATEDIEAALERARACSLVDDLRYAAVLTRTRIAQGKGQVGVEAELQRADINPHEIEGWPDQFFDEGAGSELERALDVLRRKPPRAKQLAPAAYRRLIRKGYSHDTASEAARRFAQEA